MKDEFTNWMNEGNTYKLHFTIYTKLKFIKKWISGNGGGGDQQFINTL